MAAMSKPLKNEIEITIGGKVRTMRASFSALQAIEDRLGNLMTLIGKVMAKDVGVSQCAVIIYHGLVGFNDTRLSFEEVGDEVMKMGLGKAIKPVTSFLMIAMAGVDVPLDGAAKK